MGGVHPDPRMPVLVVVERQQQVDNLGDIREGLGELRTVGGIECFHRLDAPTSARRKPGDSWAERIRILGDRTGHMYPVTNTTMMIVTIFDLSRADGKATRLISS